MEVQPHSAEAEETLLGSLIGTGHLPSDVSEVVESDDFYTDRARAVWDAMLTLEAQERQIELTSLKDQLQSTSNLTRAGGVEYLISLPESVANPGSWPHFAKEVRAYSLRRQVRAVGMSMVARADFPDMELDEMLDEIEQEVFAVRRVKSCEHEPMSSVVARVMEDLAERARHPGPRGVLAGYPEVDDLTGGFLAEQSIVIAGRPGMCKTTFAMNVGLNQTKGRALMFPLEMNREEMTLRALCCVAKVSFERASRGTLTAQERADMTDPEVIKQVERLLIMDLPTANEKTIRAVSRRLVAKENVSIVIVDYLQLMCEPTNESVSNASRSMKQMARELKVPVMVLSQLNRSLEARDNKRPMLSDLRDSGSIEQDADKVIFPYRPGYYSRDGDQTGETEVIVAKNRQGKCETRKITFIGEHMRFQ